MYQIYQRERQRTNNKFPAFYDYSFPILWEHLKGREVLLETPKTAKYQFPHGQSASFCHKITHGSG
jgi:hypothetical protein